MRDRFYGDNNDVVKWGALICLAHRHRVKHILQVPYYERDQIDLTLEVRSGAERETEDLPREVWRHFRGIEKILPLQPSVGVEIEVLKREPGDRAAYMEYVIDEVRARRHKKIVLLDPDTGIQPVKSLPGPKHARSHNIRRVFEVMRTGDFLALYQHRRQSSKNGAWVEESREQLGRAVRRRSSEIITLQCRAVTKDMVLFAVRK